MLPRGDVGRPQDLLHYLVHISGHLVSRLDKASLARQLLPLIPYAACEVLDWDVAHYQALVLDYEPVRSGDLSNNAGPGSFIDVGQVPVIVVDLEDSITQLTGRDDQEALLSLGNA